MQPREHPRRRLPHWTVIGDADHLAALKKFSERADAVTVEFENVSAPALRWLARSRPVRPGWRTLWIAQNRLREKTFLTRHEIPHAPWRPVRRQDELYQAIQGLGVPLILKTAASGYDGKGQVLVTRASEASSAGPAWADCHASPRHGLNSSRRFPSSWPAAPTAAPSRTPSRLNRHERHILDATLMPAPVGPIVALEARGLRWPWPRRSRPSVF